MLTVAKLPAGSIRARTAIMTAAAIAAALMLSPDNLLSLVLAMLLHMLPRALTIMPHHGVVMPPVLLDVLSAILLDVLPGTLTILVNHGTLVPAVLAQHLLMLAALACALPIRPLLPGGNLPVAVPFDFAAVLVPLGMVRVTLPVTIPAVVVAVPGALAIIAIPVGVELECDHRQRYEGRVVRQIHAAGLIDGLEVVARDPATKAVPYNVAPGPIRETSDDCHRVAGRDRIYSWIGRIWPCPQAHVGCWVTVRGCSHRRKPR